MGRTPEEEQLVVWSYYLGIAIEQMRTHPAASMLKEAGYRDTAEVLAKVRDAIDAARAAL